MNYLIQYGISVSLNADSNLKNYLYVDSLVEIISM